jgi:putative ABC transport system permease protein
LKLNATTTLTDADLPSHRMLNQEIEQLKVYGTVLPVVILGVAVFLLNVALSRQIGTQRRQIAALKALGCSDWQLALHYLKFVLVVVLLGGPLGVAGGAAMGHAVTQLYATFFRIPEFAYRLAPWIPLSALAVSALAAALAVLGALTRLVRLPPAEAMRPPAPPRFGPTMLERIGLGRRVSVGVRMVVREMEHRPWRTLLTILGIASAVAVMIAGTWWRDSADYLLDVEIRMRERQSMSLWLTEPASPSVLHDLAHLPGVLRAEASREAPVRLTHGLFNERTVLSALVPGSTLKPLLDQQFGLMPMPTHGLVLNRRLAQRLNVKLGDVVHVAALHGARKEMDIEVVALTSELMQMQARMALGPLNQLLGEGGAVSGANLWVDDAYRLPLLRQLKQTPRIAMVIELEPVIAYVRGNMARNILFFTTVLSVMAGAIAFGVVYNNARIALAEREWDLASLRVLGATRGEVSALLLGELGSELLLALPLGVVMGHGLAWSILQLSRHDLIELPFVITPRTDVIAAGVALLAGVVSGLLVRRRIDRLDLVAVLKTRD